jgi:hypothetical protein
MTTPKILNSVSRFHQLELKDRSAIMLAVSKLSLKAKVGPAPSAEEILEAFNPLGELQEIGLDCFAAHMLGIDITSKPLQPVDKDFDKVTFIDPK